MSGILDHRGNPFNTAGSRTTHNVAASRGQRSVTMRGKSAGPNSAVLPEISKIRDRARDAVRNSPYIANMMRTLVKHEVGTGITCRFKGDDEETQKKLQEAWDRDIPNIFAEGIGHLYAGQRMGSRGRNESGEVFLRRRRRSLNSTSGVPMQVQLLEADMLDEDYNTCLLYTSPSPRD